MKRKNNNISKYVDDIMNSFDGKFKERNKLIFSLMYYGGLRITELCNLNIENIIDSDWNIRKFIEVTALKKTRTIELNASARKIVKFFLPKDKNERGPLIVSNKKEGITPRQIQRIFKDISIKINKTILPCFCYFNYNGR
jgi:site-specific recombinase XerD